MMKELEKAILSFDLLDKAPTRSRAIVGYANRNTLTGDDPRF